MEIKEIESKLDNLEQQIQVLLLPKDPNDDRNVMIEIRAGTGGSEANIFAGEKDTNMHLGKENKLLHVIKRASKLF